MSPLPLLLALIAAPAAPPDGLDRGADYLVKHQSPDGLWRSDVYAQFRDGTALTPLVVVALQAADAAPAARRQGAAALAAMAKPDGTIDPGPDGLPYPVYAAALSVMALSHPENSARLPARDAWVQFLVGRQLTEATGWVPADPQYGGWGYYPGIPWKPAPGGVVPAQHLLESNLSATTFALDALGAAGFFDRAESGRARSRAAKSFVDRCRNRDGGFHFVHADPVRNKAGADPAGGFRSYGSATADGLRAAANANRHLLFCGNERMLPDPNPAGWLGRHFRPDHHPGSYVPAHERDRDAVYFYYAASAARTFRRLGVTEANGRPWAPALADALLDRQKSDGSWANPVELVRENDPLLATAYAVWALAECRAAPAVPPFRRR